MMFIAVAPAISQGPEDREVLVGRNVSFSCSVTGNPLPILRWYYNEIPVRSDSSHLQVNGNGSLLSINGAQPEDAGRFTCEAENNVTDLTRKITLTTRSSAVLSVIGKSLGQMNNCVKRVRSVLLAVPPKATSNTSAVTVTQGDMVSLHCQAVGIPTPIIQWFSGSNELSQTSSRSVMSSGGRFVTSSELRLLLATTTDAGDYVCRATNKGGTSNTTASLDVQCKTFDCSLA